MISGFLYQYLNQITLAAAITPGKACTTVNHSGLFLGLLPPWWEYIKDLQYDTLGQCVPNLTFPSSIYPIGLAVIDILLRIAGFAAVVAVIWAGVEFIFAQGNAERAGAAQKRIYNALIGMGIAFTAVMIVSFLGHNLTK